MAARAKKDPGTTKPKYRYQVTNWAEYDRALVSRGDLTIWFDAATIKQGWTPPPPVGRGKPGLYSALAIQTCLTLKALFRLPYRATEGLMKSLMRLNGLDLPHVRTLDTSQGCHLFLGNTSLCSQCSNGLTKSDRRLCLEGG